MKIIKKLKAIKSAATAGWIASSCPNCVISDEEETIYACPKHEAKIAKLAAENQNNW